MESLKSIYRNMSDMSKMLIKMLLGIAGSLLALFLIVVVIRLISGPKKSFSGTEKTMYDSAVSYYKKHEDELPQNGEQTEITAGELIAGEYMKEWEKYVGKDLTCEGYVTVLNNDDNYAYIPYLSCEDEYETKTLGETILKNNKLVDAGDGLYLDDNSNYVFRGEYVNNYLTLNGLNYRILRVNNDGSIRLFLENPIKDYRKSTWDNRYNVEKGNKSGINTFEISRIKEFLDSIYNDKEIFPSRIKALVVKQDLCIGSRERENNDLSDFVECSEIVEDQYLGLLQVNEYLYPSIDENCDSISSKSCLNYNYMASYQKSFWTLTPVPDSTYKLYRIAAGIYTSKASTKANILYTLHISDKVSLSSGDGTREDPYVIKTNYKK